MNKYQFMVDFNLPTTINDNFKSLIPYQKAVVDKFMEEGIITNYALSLEKGKLWMIVNAASEFEVLDHLADLPLSPYMKADIGMLNFFISNKANVPDFSMN